MDTTKHQHGARTTFFLDREAVPSKRRKPRVFLPSTSKDVQSLVQNNWTLGFNKPSVEKRENKSVTCRAPFALRPAPPLPSGHTKKRSNSAKALSPHGATVFHSWKAVDMSCGSTIARRSGSEGFGLQDILGDLLGGQPTRDSGSGWLRVP